MYVRRLKQFYGELCDYGECRVKECVEYTGWPKLYAPPIFFLNGEKFQKQ